MRPMLQSTRDIWRAVRDAGDAGLRTRAVRAVAPELRTATITERLSAMRRHGYLRYDGVTCHGVWRVGALVPHGELAQIGAAPVPAEAVPPPDYRDSTDRRVAGKSERPLQQAPRGVPHGVPASVWALAAMCAGQP